ncbi:MAG: Fic family protein [Alphaproteobacteria bacterium]
MIFAEPALASEDLAILEEIEDQRKTLRFYTQNSPRRWNGSLRRSTFARAVQASNSIEGYVASLDDALAIIDDEPSLDENRETRLAIQGYRDAMTFIMQSAADPHFEYNREFLKSLHFMMTGYDLTVFPGQWRRGTVYVVNKKTGETVYTAPDASLINDLMECLVSYLAAHSGTSAVVRAAMAHLNLTMIHPFKDGNGRMARALQTLVLAREGILHPVFSSIEEWLGHNTLDYYAILTRVGEGAWNPQNDALPWVRFCLKAHYQQGMTLIRRNEEYEALFERIEALIRREGLLERMALPLFDCALGFRLTSARYRTDVDVTHHVAGRDLKLLADRGLVDARGEKRGRYYIAGPELREIRAAVRKKRPLPDPYEAAAQAQKGR